MGTGGATAISLPPAVQGISAGIMTDDVKMQRISGHSEERFLGSDVFESSGRNLPPPRRGGTVREDAREIDVYHRCDVAVIGGGPAGCAAAWAAAKAGADVTLVERYNCLGGLSTGGLVMWIDRMTDWQGRHVIQGFARQFIERMPREGVAGPPRADWGSKDPANGRCASGPHSLGARLPARWRSGYAEDCKSLHAGSIPARASTSCEDRASPIKARASAALAQLVEHIIRNDGVTGSSPVSGTIYPFANVR